MNGLHGQRNRTTLCLLTNPVLPATSPMVGFELGDTVTIKKIKINGHLPSLLDEVETDQVWEEPDEIMHINLDRQSKFEESDEHETFEFKGKFSNVTRRKTPSRRYKTTSVPQDTLQPVKKPQARKSPT
ncbi:hypothetical protein TNCV_4021641 [Trichonephila clavipes]|nr:hypothetical protein TNCV_4021641 [Trichonephila clavipes]